MSWDNWCERGVTLGEKGQVGTKCGIFDKETGAKWGSHPSTFTVAPDQIKIIVGAINEQHRDGAIVEGNKFFFLRAEIEDNVHRYAMFKHLQDGMTCALSSKTVIVGFYDANVPAGKNSNAIITLMTQLKDTGN